ncbi:aminoglycoside phosphotransferase family protein [[Bacillus] caldolyticus]|uniref:Aminoglycoside phosphotransferase family protein n=4 Tax=Geobacillus TaxID=129337 RepID=A0ABN5G2Q6_BACCL|nr:aminoglycoside phosphotransferase family protein [[Bacillus] caldolyticus]
MKVLLHGDSPFEWQVALSFYRRSASKGYFYACSSLSSTTGIIYILFKIRIKPDLGGRGIMLSNIIDMLDYIKKQLPWLEIQEYDINNEGWDNAVLIINKEWIFRFPRSEDTAQHLLNEKLLLDFLQTEISYLSIKLPKYRLIFKDNRPICCYYSLINGVPLSPSILYELDDQTQNQIAFQISSFLTMLHKVDLEEIHSIELKDNQGYTYWKEHWENIKKLVYPYLTEQECQKITNMFESFLNQISINPLPKTIIHGDLTHKHILFDINKKQISGIIDFGDIQLGDPAYDLSGLYWDYGEQFFNKILNYYSYPFKDLNYPIDKRVTSFYGKRLIFHDLLYAIEKKSVKDFNNGLKLLKQSLV